MSEARTASASSLIHRRVKSARGEDLGRIEDLVIDLEQGFIAYAVLGFAEMMDRPRKLFVIPWGSLMADRDGRAFVLNVDREVFRNAPGLADDERLGAHRWAGGGRSVSSGKLQVSR